MKPSAVKTTWVALAAVIVATVVVYTPGLSGPFLFDDNIHITQNRWVLIEDLSPDSLVQAWKSSVSRFPSNRPLAQVSFGVNHAVSGLDTWGFKAVNLALHLLTGLAVFIFSRLGLRAISGQADQAPGEMWFALAVTALWLLHPLHVSTVLYVVQRMAQISTLFVILALSAYLWGRLRIAEGKPGSLWIAATIPLAAMGFLGKENTVLLPLLLLACELTLLRRVPVGINPWRIRTVWIALIALPLLLGIAYLVTHPGLLNHAGRAFTLEERVLTQTRVLWLYLQWLFVPDISQLGLFHDDVVISKSSLNPPTTAMAMFGWVALLTSAVAMRTRWPHFLFAVLFFLAAHALESTIFPLEMVFEHRNYLASIGPLFLLAYLVTVSVKEGRHVVTVRVLAIAIVTTYATATAMRVNNWSSYESFALSSSAHHPGSSRAQFMAGQLVISMLEKATENREQLADAARTFMQQGLLAEQRCLNCLFGLVVIDMTLNRPIDNATLYRLTSELRAGPVDATAVAIVQFDYLVQFLINNPEYNGGGSAEAIFDAALENPRWTRSGLAGIHAAYGRYHLLARDDPDRALVHMQAAVRSWPDRWVYHQNLAELLRYMGKTEDAVLALEKAETLAINAEQRAELEIIRQRLGEPPAP